jgi:hypothetical protein
MQPANLVVDRRLVHHTAPHRRKQRLLVHILPERHLQVHSAVGRRKGERTLVAAATDSSALGILDAVRQAGREQDFAIAGQGCIPEVIEEIRTGKSAIVGSISDEVETYGPRLIQLGIALLRGYTIPLQLCPPQSRNPRNPGRRS